MTNLIDALNAVDKQRIMDQKTIVLTGEDIVTVNYANPRGEAAADFNKRADFVSEEGAVLRNGEHNTAIGQDADSYAHKRHKKDGAEFYAQLAAAINSTWQRMAQLNVSEFHKPQAIQILIKTFVDIDDSVDGEVFEPTTDDPLFARDPKAAIEMFGQKYNRKGVSFFKQFSLNLNTGMELLKTQDRIYFTTQDAKNAFLKTNMDCSIEPMKDDAHVTAPQTQTDVNASAALTAVEKAFDEPEQQEET